MDEKDYELLHALDETRNITHAADKLYMTQSALSKRIKALEQELGVESTTAFMSRCFCWAISVSRPS